MVVVLVATFEILLSRAEPILRARLIQGISARFHSRVELGPFEVSLLRGFEVSGKDLAVYPYNIDSTTPMFSVRHFAFRTGYRSLFRSPMHIGSVDVEGLRINLPPKSQRHALPGPKTDHPHGNNVRIFVGEMNCTDTVLTLGTDKPGKLPLRFVIQSAFPAVDRRRQADGFYRLAHQSETGGADRESRPSLVPGMPTSREKPRWGAPIPSTMPT